MSLLGIIIPSANDLKGFLKMIVGHGMRSQDTAEKKGNQFRENGDVISSKAFHPRSQPNRHDVGHGTFQMMARKARYLGYMVKCLLQGYTGRRTISETKGWNSLKAMSSLLSSAYGKKLFILIIATLLIVPTFSTSRGDMTTMSTRQKQNKPDAKGLSQDRLGLWLSMLPKGKPVPPSAPSKRHNSVIGSTPHN
nr:protein IDA [Tanacetum cinerariifolium]